MKFMCYTEQDGNAIRIELTGTQVSMPDWKLIRDAANDKFKSAGWVREVRFPNDRRIIIALRELPTKDEWDSVTEQWLNVLEMRGFKPDRFADNAVTYAGGSDSGVVGIDDDDDDDDTDDDDDAGDDEHDEHDELPTVVISKLQKAFWEECADMVEAAKDVEKLREKYERGKETLRKERENLRQLAEYLDDQDVDCDENAECESWVEAAIEKGALEE